MPSRYEYDQDQNIVNSYPYGTVSIQDIVDNFKNILNDNKVKTGFVEVVHFDDVDDFQFSFKSADSIITAFNRMNSKKKLRAVIFVCKSDYHYGMARILHALHEYNKKDDHVMVVRNDKELVKIITKIIG